jgi:hypothetical protein
MPSQYIDEDCDVCLRGRRSRGASFDLQFRGGYSYGGAPQYGYAPQYAPQYSYAPPQPYYYSPQYAPQYAPSPYYSSPFSGGCPGGNCPLQR